MKLVWRLFLKDQPVLYWWIVVWIALLVADTAVEYVGWKSWAEVPSLSFMGWFVGGILVALLIHQESVATKSVSFWGTRPLRLRHLLLGKSLFILFYFCFIPLLIKVCLLWLTGFSGYLGLGLVEWGITYFTSLSVIVALAIVTVTLRLATMFVLAIVGWIGIVALKAVAESLKRQFEWQPELAPWWDFPTAPLVVHLVLAIGATVIALNQYLTGNRKLSWLGMGATMLGVAGVGLLPLIPYAHGSHFTSLPPSDAALDASAEALAVDLSRLCPLPQGTDLSGRAMVAASIEWSAFWKTPPRRMFVFH